MGRATTVEGVTEWCRRALFRAVLWACVLGVSGCGGGNEADETTSSAPANQAIDGTVLISWTANRETAVNKPGGGYRVYYGTTPDFSIAGAPFVDVPYRAGPTAPTQASLALPAGTFFVKVVAYSSLNPSGSDPSAEVTVTVPTASTDVARAP